MFSQPFKFRISSKFSYRRTHCRSILWRGQWRRNSETLSDPQETIRPLKVCPNYWGWVQIIYIKVRSCLTFLTACWGIHVFINQTEHVFLWLERADFPPTRTLCTLVHRATSQALILIDAVLLNDGKRDRGFDIIESGMSQSSHESWLLATLRRCYWSLGGSFRSRSWPSRPCGFRVDWMSVIIICGSVSWQSKLCLQNRDAFQLIKLLS